MKKLAHFLLTCAVLFGLGWTLWIGMRKQREKPQPEAATEEGAKTPPDAEKAEEKPEDYVVKLEKERWQALEIEKGEPEKTQIKPRRIAYGRVLDPTPLVEIDGELATAEAALAASKAENMRSQKLQAVGENLSKKAAETAEAQFRADEIKLEGLRRKALMEWGALLPVLDGQKRRQWADALVSGESFLARVDVFPGDALAETPSGARLLVMGREKDPIDAASITPASDVDPKTQAQGFVLRVDHAPFPLRPGMALTAWLELPAPPRQGFAVPRSAVLRHDGRAWVYIQQTEEKFARKPVKLDTPLDGGRGWFLDEKAGGIKADDLLVVTGAESLLSEELKAQGGAEAD